MNFKYKGFSKFLSGLALAGLVFGSAGFVGAEEYDEDTYGPEAAVVFEVPVAGVNFSHKVHTMDAGLDCDSCHDEVFQMEAGAAGAEGDFTMKAFTEGKYCGACHDGDTAFTTSGTCAACHALPAEDPMIFAKPVKAVDFSHKLHTEDMGLDCESCHDEIFVMKKGTAAEKGDYTMQSLYDGKYCGACHSEDGDAFPSNTRCNDCHIGVKGYDRIYGVAPTGHGGH